MSDKCLIFDLWGDYAHFRSIYTTSSPLTYSFPPKPTVIGILSAIVGLDKSEYLSKFYNKGFWIALQIIDPVKKARITENFYDVKNWTIERRLKLLKGETKNENIKDMPLVHTQIRIEFLKDPKFRVFVYHEDETIYNALKERLKNHSPEYTVSLGLSENLANFEYRGEADFHDRSDVDGSMEIQSVIKKTSLVDCKISLEQGTSLCIENMPVEMNQERIVSEYAEYFLEKSGKPLKAEVRDYIETSNVDSQGDNVHIVKL